MRIEILDQASRDLIEGFHFYEAQAVGLGSYFLTNLYADIESLHIYAGIHSKPYKHYHRLLARRFPFAVFYAVREETVFIHAVLDCRRKPAWIRARLD
jgi:plasmid stabilization system protein ParE